MYVLKITCSFSCPFHRPRTRKEALWAALLFLKKAVETAPRPINRIISLSNNFLFDK
jgi:hypothetical protein